MSRALRFRLFPNGKDLFHTGVGLATGVVRQKRIHQALIQRQLASVGGYVQHVVLAGVDLAVADFFGTVGKVCDHVFLDLARLQGNVCRLAAGQFWHRQMQHIGGLNVGTLLEHAHQFRQVVKPRESRFCAVACTLGRKLDG